MARFIPSAARLFFDAPWWRNLFDNTLTVQFEHRMTAYALFVLAILHAVDAIRSRAGARRGQRRRCGWWLRSRCRRRSAFSRCSIRCRSIWRLTHQAVAIAVLTLAVFQAERLTARQPEPAPRNLVLPLAQTG